MLQETIGLGAPGVSGINAWLDLVRVPPSGTWDRRRADLFAAAADWIGPPPRARTSRGDRRAGAQLPARLRPGQRRGDRRLGGARDRGGPDALELLELRRFRAEDGEELVDLPRLPLPDPERRLRRASCRSGTRRCSSTPASQILPERHRPKVFSTKTPQSMATFLVDGRVAGTWRYEKGRVEIEPFERLDSARPGVDEEAERLAAFHG